MSDDKQVKVYLLVECVMDLNCDAKPEKVRLLAKEQIDAAIMSTSDVLGKEGPWFDLGNGGMYARPIIVLPDDIHAILKRDKMRGVPLHEQLRQAIIEDGKKPAAERWKALVDRGAINENGEVLLRGPGCNEGEVDD